MATNCFKEKWGSSCSFLDVKKKNKVKASTRSEDERNGLAWNKHWNKTLLQTRWKTTDDTEAVLWLLCSCHDTHPTVTHINVHTHHIHLHA